MSDHQPHAKAPTAAEALLRECTPAAEAEQRALRELLTAAGAPARARDLDGEAAALAAFRSARGPALDLRSRPAMKRTLATVFRTTARPARTARAPSGARPARTTRRPVPTSPQR